MFKYLEKYSKIELHCCLAVGFFIVLATYFLYGFITKQIMAYVILHDAPASAGLVILHSIKGGLLICLIYIVFSIVSARFLGFFKNKDDHEVWINVFSLILINDFLPKRYSKRYFFSLPDLFQFILYILFFSVGIYNSLSEYISSAFFLRNGFPLSLDKNLMVYICCIIFFFLALSIHTITAALRKRNITYIERKISVFLIIKTISSCFIFYVYLTFLKKYATIVYPIGIKIFGPFLFEPVW